MVLVLPVFNESGGIREFLLELDKNLSDLNPYFVVVDDCSTDQTGEILDNLKLTNFPIHLIRNSNNSGHGFSVIQGLSYAVSQGFTSIVTCDGDGQFLGSDIRKLVLAHNSSGLMVEGVRVGRNDPWFRTFISSITRLLVWSTTFEMPKDANTPLRAMSLAEAKFFLQHINGDCKIPNLAISALSRARKKKICEVNVQSIPPRRLPGAQDQWKQKSEILPSKRLIYFSISSMMSWLKIVKTIASSIMK